MQMVANLWLYGGDFGDEPHRGSFLANGVLTADRQPHPHAFQVKQSYRPITAQPVDLVQGEVAIKNKNWFTDTSNYLLHWELTADGKIIQTGELDCPAIVPQETAEIQLSLTPPAEPAAEFHLKIIYLLKDATLVGPG